MQKISKKVLKGREKRLVRKQEIKLWNLLRENIISKQGNKCYLCEKEFKNSKMDIHHIIDRRVRPLKFEPLNLVGLCKRCHRLSFQAVHQSCIIFSEKLRLKENERYYFLLKKFDEYAKDFI